MISASRRRRGSTGLGDSLQLHLRLARRAALDRRLLHGALGALAASLAGLAFASTLGVHALLAVAGFAVGAALPTPGSLARAFGSIREQAGLSYETALELHSVDASEPDPYDFRTRVDERARLSVRDVRPNSPPAWWLPLALVAFGLLLIPGFAPPSANGTGQGFMAGSDPAGQSAGADQGAGGPESEIGLGDASPDRSAETDDLGSDDPGDVPPAGSDPPSGAGDGSAPLSRFLENLRERPADAGSGRTQEPDGAGQPDQPGSQSADPLADGEADPRRFEIGENSGGSERDLVAGTGDPDGESPDGDASVDGAGGDEEGDGATPPSGPRNPFEQAGGPSEDLGQDPVGGDQPGDREGLTPSADSSGEDGGDGIAGEGAGGLTPAGTADAQNDDDTDVLRGVLIEGPESSLGTVLLPGRDEVELPAGVSFAQYAAAAEDALSEGDIPLEYQEILRRYFR